MKPLKGCAGLLRMRKWNGNSPGIVKTCFWAFARIGLPSHGLTMGTQETSANNLLSRRVGCIHLEPDNTHPHRLVG